MGMAASQARLLCLTARIHDVEFQAQSIQNAKLQLATQSDQAYNEYLEALDAQTMVLRAIDPLSGAQSTVAATFSNLCSSRHLTPSSSNTNYAMKDSRGRLIVEREVAENYPDFVNRSAQEFALFMAYGIDEDVNTVKSKEDEVAGNEPTVRLTNISAKLTELTEKESKDGSLSEDDAAEKARLEKAYKKELYRTKGFEIVNGLDNSIDEETYDKNLDRFNYYVSVYNQIKANGGCYISIDKFNGFAGDASNDPEWLTTMVQCGQITIENVVTEDDGSIVFDTTSPSSDTSISYVETTSIDPRELKKAEAKYEHDLKQIEQQDKKYDLSLSRLETERQALTKEQESVKKVIQENIDKTFSIFS